MSIGSGPDGIVLDLSEDAYLGDAEFTVSVDGQQIGGTQTVTALQDESQTEAFAILGTFAPGQHTVSVDFLNDAYAGTATTDRNLYVDNIITAGGPVETNAELATDGSQSFTVTVPANPTPSPVTLGAGPDSIVVDLSEDAYLGDAQFTISVDGQQIGGTQTATAQHALGQTQAFNLLGDFAPGTHDVTVNFLNDAYAGTATTDRNLYVDSITTASGTVATNAELVSNGSQDFTATLPAVTPAPVTVGSGPDSLVLQVSEDFYLADAAFTVSVDGKQIGGTLSTNALQDQGQTQSVTVLGNFAAGTHTVSVDFLNDAYAGTATTDSNLYVDSVTYGATTTTTNTILATDGSVDFSFQVPAASSVTTPPATTPPAVAPVSVTSPVVTSPVTTAPASSSSSTPPATPAYYVAVNGSDTTGNGSQADPFATLARAQSAMESGSVRTTYVEGGTYELTNNLQLTAADNGMSFIAASGQQPILDGSAHNLINLISLSGAQNITLQGLTFENTTPGYSNGAVSLYEANNNTIVGNLFNNNDTGVLLAGSSNNIISGNEVNNSVIAGVNAGADGAGNTSNNNTIESNQFDGTSMQGTGNNSGAVYLTGADNNMITHNAISNTAGAAIVLANWLMGDNPSNENIGNTISYNSITNANSSPEATDSGAISIGNSSGVDTRTLIDHNYVEISTLPTNTLNVGIYLDNWTSGATVTNNIVVGGNYGFLIHGGENDTISNNIFDMGTEALSNYGVGLIQGYSGGPVAAMTNDVVTQNIVYSTATTSPNAYVEDLGGMAAISNNLYYNTNGQPMQGNLDTSPKTGNPNFANVAGGSFALGAGSAASAIGFQSIDQSGIGLAPTTAHYY